MIWDKKELRMCITTIVEYFSVNCPCTQRVLYMIEPEYARKRTKGVSICKDSRSLENNHFVSRGKATDDGLVE